MSEPEPAPVEVPAVSAAVSAEPSAESVRAAGEVFDADYCKSLYDALGQVEAVVFGKVFRLPKQVAADLFLYSEAEKNLLAPATARVVKKYAPQWAERYAEEIGLAVLFGTIFYGKVQAALEYKVRQAALSGEAARPSGPTGHGANGDGGQSSEESRGAAL